jgi:PAS domain S-box-containing protein
MYTLALSYCLFLDHYLNILWLQETFSQWFLFKSCNATTYWILLLNAVVLFFVLLKLHHDQSKIQAKVKADAEQLCQLAENIDEIFYIADSQLSQILYVNPAYEWIWGRSCQSLYDQPLSFIDAIHPEDQAGVREYLERQKQGERRSTEYRVMQPDGQIRWVWDHSFPLPDQSGQVYYICGVVRDITQRKQAEEAWHQEFTFRSQIIDQMAEGLCVCHEIAHFPFVHFTIWSQQMVELTGYTLEEINRQGWYQTLYPDPVLQEKVIERMARMREGDGLQGEEWEIVRADGITRLLSISTSLLETQTGESYVLALMRDVTEHKASEEALRKSESKHRALIQALPDLIMRMTVDGVYLDFFPTQNFKVFGSSDLVGEGIYEGSLPLVLAEQRMGYIQQAVQTSKLQVYEQEIMVEGELRTEEVRIVVCGEDEVLVIVRDMTDRKTAEQALQRQAQQEQAFNRVVQAMRNSLDLGQILAAINRELVQLLAVTQVSIVQYLRERRCWAVVAGSCLDVSMSEGIGLEIPDENNPLAAQLKCMELVRLDDTQTIHDPVNQPIAQYFPGAWLLIPIGVQGEVWGSLTLHRAETAVAWKDDEVELALRVADQVAIAIQQSTLYQQLQQLNSTLDQQVQERTTQLQQSLHFEALLKRITDKVRDSLDENQILGTAVQELALGLQIECCDAGIYSSDRKVSTIAYEYTKSIASARNRVFEITKSPHPEVYPHLFQGEYVHFCPLTPNWLRNNPNRFTVLACPIMDDQGILGDLWLFEQPQEYFSESKIRLVQQIANQCAIALRQSHLYQAAQSQVVELEKLNQLKDDFLSTVSHELRTPMSNIKMATQMIELSLNHLGLLERDTSLNHYFEVLQDEGQRELDLINDLLELTRLDAETEPLMRATISLQDWIPYIAEPFLRQIEEHQQYLQFEIPADLPSLTTDLTYLERILSELLNNACKYTPRGEVIRISAILGEPLDEVRTSNTQPFTPSLLQISITNTGVEIPASERDRIFEKFYRIPSNDPWKYSGTGLGLTLVKKFVKKLGGQIELISSSGQTTFSIWLPRELHMSA